MEKKLRTFDREVRFDERSRNFPIRELLKGGRLSNKIWKCTHHLDQGREGACVGFAWTHELNAVPYEIRVETNTAKTIYYAAQQWDQWAGTDYDGTSVIAGAKTVQSLGFMPEYRWAFGIDDVLGAISQQGPVVLGVNWYEGMFNTNEDGFITPTGELAGGHAILAKGVVFRKRCKGCFWWKDLEEPYVVLHNSWGTDWGVNGDAYILASDLEKLLNEYGEACVPVKRKRN
jgi:hypothetical protein